MPPSPPQPAPAHTRSHRHTRPRILAGLALGLLVPATVAWGTELHWRGTSAPTPQLVRTALLADAVPLLAQINPSPGTAPHPAPGTPGHGRPPLPRFINFETGANVKALAMHGRNLWVGLPNGLVRYNVDSYDDHEIFTVASTRGGHPGQENARAGLPANGIYALDVAPDGALWISTYGGGLTRYDGTHWQTYTPVEGLGDRWVYDVEFGPDGRMWVATWKGLSVRTGDAFTTYTEADGLIDKWVYDIAVDADGVVWAGTEGGLSRFDGTTWTSYTHADGLGANIPSAERKAVATMDSRHHRAQGKANQGFNPNYVLSIAIADDGKKWIGTWGAGLSVLDGSQWTSYTAADGLGGNFVHAVLIDDAGTVWAATDGGVSYLKEGRWKTFNSAHGLQNDNVFSMLFQPDGTRWFGTWTGLSRMPRPPAISPRGPGNPHGVPVGAISVPKPSVG